MQRDPHKPQVLSITSTEQELCQQIQLLKVKIVLFLYWHLLCFFWGNTQCNCQKNSYFEPLYSAAELSKTLFQK